MTGEDQHAAPSMTRREYFAAAALQGLLAGRIPGAPNTNPQWAEWAVRLADAMLAALDAPQERK